MNLDEMISALEFQLTIPHSQPHTVPRITAALALLKEARELWLEPGKQRAATLKENEAKEVLRNLDKPKAIRYYP